MQTGPVRGNWWNSLQSYVHWPVFQPGKTGGGSGFGVGIKRLCPSDTLVQLVGMWRASDGVFVCAGRLSSGHLAGRKKNKTSWLTRVGPQELSVL